MRDSLRESWRQKPCFIHYDEHSHCLNFLFDSSSVMGWAPAFFIFSVLTLCSASAGTWKRTAAVHFQHFLASEQRSSLLSSTGAGARRYHLPDGDLQAAVDHCLKEEVLAGVGT